MPLDAMVGEYVPAFASDRTPRERICWRAVVGAKAYSVRRDGKEVASISAGQDCWTGEPRGNATWTVVPAGGKAMRAVPSRFRIVGNDLDPAGEYINALAVDASGRAWVGTRGCAVARFDGAWSAIPVPTGCGNDGVTSIKVAVDGGVWVNVDDVGVLRLDPEMEVWRSFLPAADGGRDWLASGDDATWFLGPNTALVRLDREESTVALPLLPEKCSVMMAAGDPAKQVWAATTCGLLQLRRGEAPVWYRAEAGVSDEVLSAYLNDEHSLWLTTGRRSGDHAEARVGRFDIDAGALTPAAETFGKHPSVTVRRGSATVVDGERICVSSHGTWTCESGPASKARGVLVADGWWLGNGRIAKKGESGWDFFTREPERQSATTVPVIEMPRASNDIVWIFARQHAWRVERGKGMTEHIDLKGTFGKGFLPDLKEDGQGNVWALAEKRLLRRTATQTFTGVRAPVMGDPPELLSVDAAGAAWLRGVSLLTRIEPSGAVTTVLTYPLTRLMADPTDRSLMQCESLTVPGIGDVCAEVDWIGPDADGRMNILTDQGLVRLDAKGVPLGIEPVPFERVIAMGQAPSGEWWAAGQNGFWLRGKSTQWEKQLGVPPEVITGALPLSDGSWWLFTSYAAWHGRLGGAWTQAGGRVWLDPIRADADGSVWAASHNSPQMLRRWDAATGRWTLPLEAIEPLLSTDGAPSPLGGAALPEKLLFAGEIDGYVTGFLAEVTTADGITHAHEGIYHLESLPTPSP